MRMRKKRNGSERINALSSLLCVPETNSFINPKEIFQNDAPVRIEIGCGKGGFITALTKAEPAYNYFAMERIPDVIMLAMEKYAEDRGLGSKGVTGGWVRPDGVIIGGGNDETWDIPAEDMGNLRFIRGDAGYLSDIFAPGSIDRIYINFCDPWHKARHAKRRLTHSGFLTMYHKLLKAGGTIYFKTDNRPLFDFSVEEFEASPFRVDCVTYDLHNSEYADGNIMTEYEKNFSEKGFTINMLRATKCGD